MGKYIKEIDQYIAKSAAFAKPILEHVRELVHETCPDVQEKMKWSFPHFDYMDEMMCSMAAFKQHCVVGFWKASLMKDKSLLEMARSEQAMGHFGKITSLKDLPPDKKIAAYIREAMTLTEHGIRLPAKPKTTEKKPLEIPAEFTAALKKNNKAQSNFENFPPSQKKEYSNWIAEAKTAPTRDRRIKTAVEWISEGKHRHWQYQKEKP